MGILCCAWSVDISIPMFGWVTYRLVVGGGGKFRKFTVSIVCLVFIHILNCKMTLFFGICFFLYFLKLSAGHGF